MKCLCEYGKICSSFCSHNVTTTLITTIKNKNTVHVFNTLLNRSVIKLLVIQAFWGKWMQYKDLYWMKNLLMRIECNLHAQLFNWTMWKTEFSINFRSTKSFAKNQRTNTKFKIYLTFHGQAVHQISNEHMQTWWKNTENWVFAFIFEKKWKNQNKIQTWSVTYHDKTINIIWLSESMT